MDETWSAQPLPLWPARAAAVPALQLRELRLDGVPLGRGSGAASLLATVATCSHLTRLSMSSCGVGPACAERLRRAVELSKGLQALHLSGNRCVGSARVRRQGRRD